jgi:long-chain fatty acid transport protein
MERGMRTAIGHSNARARAIGVALAGILLALLAGSSQAGGLYVATWGTPSMGTASAGANALAGDASTAIQNPAGMTRLDDHHLLVGLAPGFTDVQFDLDESPVGGGNGGQQGGFVPISSNQYVHKVSERWRLGLSLLSISGAVLDPNNGWAGRNQITEVSLFSLTLMPSAAVRVCEWLSLGAGAAVTYASLDMKVRLPIPPLGEPPIKLKGLDDFGAAPLVSVLVEPTPGLRLGVVYLGETDFDLEGKAKLQGRDAHIVLDLPLAQTVRGSVYWDATDRFALLASAGWEDWSAASTLPLSAPGGSIDIPLGFRDTWYVAGGVHFQLNDAWMLQTGLRYDSSALKDSDRTTAFPVDRAYTLGVGALHDWSESLRLAFSFSWTDLGSAKVNSPGVVKGDYSSNDLYLFAVSLNWKKLPWSGKATL